MELSSWHRINIACLSWNNVEVSIKKEGEETIVLWTSRDFQRGDPVSSQVEEGVNPKVWLNHNLLYLFSNKETI